MEKELKISQMVRKGGTRVDKCWKYRMKLAYELFPQSENEQRK